MSKSENKPDNSTKEHNWDDLVEGFEELGEIFRNLDGNYDYDDLKDNYTQLIDKANSFLDTNYKSEDELKEEALNAAIYASNEDLSIKELRYTLERVLKDENTWEEQASISL